jgi:hypothetical protein
MGAIMSDEQLRTALNELAAGDLKALAGEFGLRIKSKMKKGDIIEEILRGVPRERIEDLKRRVDEIASKKISSKRAGKKGASMQQDLLRELSEIRRILDERLPARVPSFRDFTRILIDEYWKLGGSFVSYERLREAVCNDMLITPEQFDTWFNDLVWASAGRLTVGESRTSSGRSVHVLMKARTPEELIWGG